VNTNFVLVVSDDTTLHHDTLSRLGIPVDDKATILRTDALASSTGLTVRNRPRTT